MLIIAIKTNSMTYGTKSLHTRAHVHAKHKSPSIPEHPAARWLEVGQGANWAKRRRRMEAGGLNLQHLISAK